MVGVTPRAVLTAAGALAIALAGAGAGAGLYSAIGPTKTTTVVQSTTTVDHSQPASATSGLSINAIYQRTYQGVVDIQVQSDQGFSPFGGCGSSRAEGSGFVYDKRGNIVTNQHVVSGATSIRVRFWNGKTFSAKLVGSDSSTDLAVVRVASAPSSLLHPLTLGDSSRVQVGDAVIAIGSPFGLSETVTSGIVSALHRSMDAPNNYTISDSIQTDAPINHGNSGGPLIDTGGHVIGVNAQIQSDSGGSDGVGFAIPANTVRSVVSQLVAGKAVEHAYLGIQVSTPVSAQGAGVADVKPNTPASRAGLRSGDVIVRLGDRVIASPEDLSSVIDGAKPGDSLSLTYVRGGKQHTITVKLGTRPS
jgi:putative serine protease PepD